jgi:hypothetical protein
MQEPPALACQRFERCTTCRLRLDEMDFGLGKGGMRRLGKS